MTYELTDENLINFPGTLSAARNFAGYTQYEAAMAIGVTPQTILKWERGKGTIQKGKRQAAANFIRSTGMLAAETGEDPSNEIKAAFIGRIATGPALSAQEVQTARDVGVHHDYASTMEAFEQRLIHGPQTSVDEIDLLVETVLYDARLRRESD